MRRCGEQAVARSLSAGPARASGCPRRRTGSGRCRWHSRSPHRHPSVQAASGASDGLVCDRAAREQLAPRRRRAPRQRAGRAGSHLGCGAFAPRLPGGARGQGPARQRAAATPSRASAAAGTAHVQPHPTAPTTISTRPARSGSDRCPRSRSASAPPPPTIHASPSTAANATAVRGAVHRHRAGTPRRAPAPRPTFNGVVSSGHDGRVISEQNGQLAKAGLPCLGCCAHRTPRNSDPEPHNSGKNHSAPISANSTISSPRAPGSRRHIHSPVQGQERPRLRADQRGRETEPRVPGAVHRPRSGGSRAAPARPTAPPTRPGARWLRTGKG